jgi:small subunit ribosomal protein S17
MDETKTDTTAPADEQAPDEPTAEAAEAGAETDAPEGEAAEGDAPDATAEDDGDAPTAAPVAEADVEAMSPIDAMTAAAVRAVTAEPEEASAERNMRKERVGIVVSDKMQKTITVLVRRQMKHPMYSKYLERSTKMLAHDEHNEAGEGDTVRIMETRPTSKRKRWRLVDILERAK